MRSLALLFLPFLTACDAWPTVVDNQTSADISVQYLHKDYDHWSGSFPVRARIAVRLSRAHWIQDIKAVRFKDGQHTYLLASDALGRLQDACPSSVAARKYSVAGDCYLIYLGRGKVQVTASEPQRLRYEGVRE
jgi:hypothetical protein